MSRPETKVNRKTQSDHKQVEQELRAKVSSLEEEVRSLKRKLDELRKAKNTTLIKKEKEFVTTGFPRRETDDSESHKVKSENESLTKELKSLKLDRGELEARLKAIEAVGDSPCEHEEIINALQDRLAELESYNTALTMSHEELHAKLEQAYSKSRSPSKTPLQFHTTISHYNFVLLFCTIILHDFLIVLLSRPL